MRRELLGYLVAALAVGGVKWTYDYGQRQAGVLQERLRVTDSTIVVLQKRTKVVDTVYRRDTIRLTRRIQQWDTVTRVAEALPDTVRVPVETVRWIVAAGDSVISSCRTAISSCESRVNQRDSLIGALHARNTAISIHVRRDVYRKWLERITWAGLVVLVAR